MKNHKAGFVNIIGAPNAGKSTLMNALVGERLSIITSKAQTTRHRIMGIVNGDDFQIVYSDTPGIIRPAYKLQEKMMRFVESALSDADVILYVTDVNEEEKTDEKVLDQIEKLNIPILVLLNKIDLSTQEKVTEKAGEWKARMKTAEVIPVSALKKFNIEYILERLVTLLPESPPFFDKEQLTDKTERFFVSEIIREKILLLYQQEIPYSCEVVVEEYKEKKNITMIRAVIMVERDSQKGILIGNRGAAIKKLGTTARIDIEKFLGKKVFLELFVKVDKDWRSDESRLKRFGYVV